MVKQVVFVITLLGILVLLLVGCGNGSKEEPTGTSTSSPTVAAKTTPLFATTSTAQVNPTSSSVRESSRQQIKNWIIQVLLDYRSFLDVTENVGEIPIDLLGRKVTRDQALAIVQQKKEKLSEILSSLEESPPPPSAKYGTDLEEIHTSLAGAVRAVMASLESLTDYIGYVPSDGGMPSNLEEANKCLETATAKAEEASSLSDKGLAKAEKIALEVKD